MRLCSQCHTEKPESEFHSSGNGYLRGNCKSCQVNKARLRKSKLRKEYVEWKKTLVCNRCGYDDYRALQFHHHSDDKDHDVSSMLTKGFSLDKIKAEAAKCEVLCANCHQIEHHKPEQLSWQSTSLVMKMSQVRILSQALGAVAQLVRVPACHAGCRGFKSHQSRCQLYIMTYKAEFYQIPTGIDATLAKHIIDTIHLNAGAMEKSMTGGGMLGDGSFAQSIADNAIRKSTQRWIATDHWLSGMMAHFIREANKNYFQFDLIGWSDQIQYTEYNGKGTHYKWHCDTNHSVLIPNTVRKLSISLLLSDPSDYDGGEFQILNSDASTMKTFKPDIGQAIIFPSYLTHRVRPLKSGKRVSLVGWYGGSPFR